MGKAVRGQDSPSISPSPGPVCPDCGGPIWDNFEANELREARGEKRMPDLKCRDKGCGWLKWNIQEVIREDYPPFDGETGEIIWPEGEEPYE
jgi:hypothetical protein